VDEKIYSIAERKGQLANAMLGEGGDDDTSDAAQVVTCCRNVAVCLSVLQCVVLCYTALQGYFGCHSDRRGLQGHCNVWQFIAVCCSALQ